MQSAAVPQQWHSLFKAIQVCCFASLLRVPSTVGDETQDRARVRETGKCSINVSGHYVSDRGFAVTVVQKDCELFVTPPGRTVGAVHGDHLLVAGQSGHVEGNTIRFSNGKSWTRGTTSTTSTSTMPIVSPKDAADQWVKQLAADGQACTGVTCHPGTVLRLDAATYIRPASPKLAQETCCQATTTTTTTSTSTSTSTTTSTSTSTTVSTTSTRMVQQNTANSPPPGPPPPTPAPPTPAPPTPAPPTPPPPTPSPPVTEDYPDTSRAPKHNFWWAAGAAGAASAVAVAVGVGVAVAHHEAVVAQQHSTSTQQPADVVTTMPVQQDVGVTFLASTLQSTLAPTNRPVGLAVAGLSERPATRQTVSSPGTPAPQRNAGASLGGTSPTMAGTPAPQLATQLPKTKRSAQGAGAGILKLGLAGIGVLAGIIFVAGAVFVIQKIRRSSRTVTRTESMMSSTESEEEEDEDHGLE